MKSKRFKVEAPDEEMDTALLGFDDGDAEATECSNNFIDCNESGELNSPQPQSRWTPESTRVMLQLRFDRQLEFQQRLRQKKELWSEIAGEMRRQGLCDFSLTAEVCDLKYRNMLQTYKKNRLKEDGGMQSLIVWEYYEMFKEALKAAEEAEAQEGNERIVPSMLCDTVCEAQNDDDNGIPVAICTEPGSEVMEDTIDIKDEEVKSTITTSNRKRSRASARIQIVKSEVPPPSNLVISSVCAAVEQPSTDGVAATTQELDSIITSNEMIPPTLSNAIKIDAPTRTTRKRQRSSLNAIPTPVDTSATDVFSEAPINVQSEPVISSSSMAVLPPLTHAPITIVHPTNLSNIPAIGLAPTEMRECQVFGESIGLQLANVRDAHIRAVLQLKIQELLYMAKTGKLFDNVRI